MIDLTQLTIVKKLGEGSQGKVFLATDPEGARFTVKLVVLGDNVDRKPIFDRAWLFRPDALDPSMIPILSHGMVSSTPSQLTSQLGKLSKDALVLVLPFVAGTTLAEIEARGDLTLQEGVAALAGIGSALARLPPGIVHGDLRAPNIYVRPSGEVALSDPDLTSNPDPADDLRALAAIGLNLARIAKPTENRRAVEDLQALIAEIAIPGELPPADEVAQRLGDIAVLLGAPALKVNSVLAKQVSKSELGVGAVASSAAAASGSEWVVRRHGGRRHWGWALAAAVILVAGTGWLVATHWRSERPMSARGAGAEPPDPSSESLYDHSGTVHYPETIHLLGPNELADARDGVFQATFEFPIERLAILSKRKDVVLWEVRHPAAGGVVYLDVKPGRYYVEEDRDLGDDAGLQRDQRPVMIDRRNPLRIVTTEEIVSSPRRPGG